MKPTKAVSSVSTMLTGTNNQIPRASLPIRAGALFSCPFCPREDGVDTIAAGSAYPARQHADGKPRYKTVVSPKERGLLMKREDVKAKIPGITDEQLNWLMSENGADINREKTVAEQFKTQFEKRTGPAQDRAGRPEKPLTAKERPPGRVRGRADQAPGRYAGTGQTASPSTRP